jgi:hypothetical protein
MHKKLRYLTKFFVALVCRNYVVGDYTRFDRLSQIVFLFLLPVTLFMKRVKT